MLRRNKLLCVIMTSTPLLAFINSKIALDFTVTLCHRECMQFFSTFHLPPSPNSKYILWNRIFIENTYYYSILTNNRSQHAVEQRANYRIHKRNKHKSTQIECVAHDELQSVDFGGWCLAQPDRRRSHVYSVRIYDWCLQILIHQNAHASVILWLSPTSNNSCRWINIFT